jgi:hypothetical protein
MRVNFALPPRAKRDTEPGPPLAAGTEVGLVTGLHIQTVHIVPRVIVRNIKKK